jgi:hypothetical protein
MMVVAASKMVRNATFTHLKVPARSTKTVKEECAQQLNDIVSFNFTHNFLLNF